jgi:hypothetical protein
MDLNLLRQIATDMNTKLLRQIEVENGDFMPGPKERKDSDNLERAGLIAEAAFFGGGGLTYKITEKGRRWLAAEGEPLLQAMIQRDAPVTRESYIQMVYGKEEPEEWTPEHESNLPQELQDWSAFDEKP